MTDPVALALIAAAVPVVATLGGNFILTWRAAILASDARKVDEVWKAKVDEENARSIRERTALQIQTARLEAIAQAAASAAAEAAAHSDRKSDRNNSAIELVHAAVNGGMKAAKIEIADLKSEIGRLNLIAEHDRLGAAAVAAARVVTAAAETAALVIKSDAATAGTVVTDAATSAGALVKDDAATASALISAVSSIADAIQGSTPTPDAGHPVRGTYR